MNRVRSILGVCALFAWLAAGSAAAHESETAFTVQAQLMQNDQPVEGSADIEVFLFDREEGGNQIGTAVRVSNVEVRRGLVKYTLDFGADAFRDGGQRWLETRVRVPHDPNDQQPFTPLAGRICVGRTPYTMRADTSAELNTPVTLTFGDESGEGKPTLTFISTGPNPALEFRVTDQNSLAAGLRGVYFGTGDLMRLLYENPVGTGTLVSEAYNGSGTGWSRLYSNSASNATGSFFDYRGLGDLSRRIYANASGTGALCSDEYGGTGDMYLRTYQNLSGTGSLSREVYDGSGTGWFRLYSNSASNATGGVYIYHGLGDGLRQQYANSAGPGRLWSGLYSGLATGWFLNRDNGAATGPAAVITDAGNGAALRVEQTYPLTDGSCAEFDYAGSRDCLVLLYRNETGTGSALKTDYRGAGAAWRLSTTPGATGVQVTMADADDTAFETNASVRVVKLTSDSIIANRAIVTAVSTFAFEDGNGSTGGANQVLTADGNGGLSWQDPSGAGGSPDPNFNSVTVATEARFGADPNNATVLIDGTTGKVFVVDLGALSAQIAGTTLWGADPNNPTARIDGATGNVQANDVNAGGTLTAATVQVSGDCTVGGALTSDSILTPNFDVTSLHVFRQVSFGTDPNLPTALLDAATGDARFKNGDFGGSVIAAGSLSVGEDAFVAGTLAASRLSDPNGSTGAAGQVLTATGAGGYVWLDAPGGGGSDPIFNSILVTGNSTLGDDPNDVTTVTGTLTVTGPLSLDGSVSTTGAATFAGGLTVGDPNDPDVLIIPFSGATFKRPLFAEGSFNFIRNVLTDRIQISEDAIGSPVVQVTGSNSSPFVPTALFRNFETGGVAISTTGHIHVKGNLCATGTIIGNSNCGGSDARLKTNVEDLTGALEIVRRLRGVRFDWRRDEFPERRFSEGRQIGFIAQELAEVLPEVVVSDKDGYYAVDYGKTTAVLAEAVKELDARLTQREAQIDSQQRQLDAQDKQIASLSERLARLEALLSAGAPAAAK